MLFSFDSSKNFSMKDIQGWNEKREIQTDTQNMF